jgi:ABC-2 type transport system permease protein
MTSIPAPARTSFVGALASERIKLTSLRSMRWLGLLTLVLGALGTFVPAQSGIGVFASVASLGGPVLALVGALASAGEFATGTIRTTMIATPRRAPAVLAKVLVTAAGGAVLAIVSALVALVIMAPGARDQLTPISFLLATLGLAFYYGAVAAFMTCVGFAVRRVPIAITVAILYVLLLPGMIGGVVVGDHVYLSDFTLTEAGIRLLFAAEVHSQLWMSLGVTTAWLALAGVAAIVLMKRRDV